MKKTILFTILALLGMTQAVAQEYEYVPFVREGVKWVYVCDERLSIDDVSTFADYLLDNITFDIYQEKAADINGDGIIDIVDFTALTDLLLGAG